VTPPLAKGRRRQRAVTPAAGFFLASTTGAAWRRRAVDAGPLVRHQRAAERGSRHDWRRRLAGKGVPAGGAGARMDRGRVARPPRFRATIFFSSEREGGRRPDGPRPGKRPTGEQRQRVRARGACCSFAVPVRANKTSHETATGDGGTGDRKRLGRKGEGRPRTSFGGVSRETSAGAATGVVRRRRAGARHFGVRVDGMDGEVGAATATVGKAGNGPARRFSGDTGGF